MKKQNVDAASDDLRVSWIAPEERKRLIRSAAVRCVQLLLGHARLPEEESSRDDLPHEHQKGGGVGHGDEELPIGGADDLRSTGKHQLPISPTYT